MVEKSPMKEAYKLLGAQTPFELFDLYDKEDQRLMKAGLWDYDNPNLIVNKIKNIIESIDINELTEEENEWRQEILWFWYHHAISCAIWRYKDKDKAKIYSAKAFQYHLNDNQNQITKLLDFLVNGQVKEAEEWAEKIQDEVEQKTASDLIKEYKEKGFF